MPVPGLRRERKYWNKGLLRVAGADEVGRGSFAGPIVAGCVLFSPEIKPDPKVRIDDSKRLSEKARQIAEDWIRKNALVWGVGVSGASLINRVGMAKATHAAFRIAISKVCTNGPIDFLLVDAFYVPWIRGLRRKNQEAIIKGDQKSFSIASASIIAKVYRDGLMQKLSQRPEYRKYAGK